MTGTMGMMKRFAAAGLLALAVVLPAWPDAGVLLPADQDQPDPAILSLDEMSIDIHVDNSHAQVRIQQIFGSHRGTVLEGNYLFTAWRSRHLGFRCVG